MGGWPRTVWVKSGLVLVDLEFHDDAVVRGDLGRHVELQHRLLEGYIGSARGAPALLLVRNLLAHLDGRLLGIGGDDPGLEMISPRPSFCMAESSSCKR
jgi:hypothetical protein